MQKKTYNKLEALYDVIVEEDEDLPGFYDFVLYDGDRKIGLIQAGRGDTIMYLWIRGSYRRKNLATKLYNFACEYLGVKLYPATINNTTEAISFWESVGVKVAPLL